MLELSLNNVNLLDSINKANNAFIRTPEPSEVCEFDSMHVLADWLYWASQNNLVSQERYIKQYQNI